MKRVGTVCWLVLLLAVLVMAVNRFLMPLPDWAVRADGVLLLAAMAATVFATVKDAQAKR